MRKLFTSKQEESLISVYYYMKDYEERLTKMFNKGKLNLSEYNNLINDIKQAIKHLEAVISIHIDDIFPE